MAIGVFGLQVAYKLKRTEVMSLNDTHGWFGGGLNPTVPALSTVDRIDFSNDSGTALVRGLLSSARYHMGATGNSNYGWFGGGYVPGSPTRSTVDRIDFSNDSATASPRGPLSQARRLLAATGNSNYGWFGAGYNPSAPVSKSTVDRIDFSNDSSTASPRGPLSSARYYLAATGNSNYGWFGGGAPGQLVTVDRIDFSNDSVSASVRGPLSAGRYTLSATGNSNYGWFGGGIISGPSVVATVDRIDFSNDAATAFIRGPLSQARSQLAATGNSNYGWFGGGLNFTVPANYSTVDRIDFSNDSGTASPRCLLNSLRNSGAATAGQAKGPAIKLQKTGNYGWFGGGFIPAFVIDTATVDRIDFSNDLATASPRGSLSLSRYSLAATGNSNYGWFGGGLSPAASPTQVSTVDRIDFSNDSATASPRGLLSLRRSNLAATGNSNYGWFGGGSQPGFYSTVDRIDFSNDSSTASVRGSLNSPGGRTELAATGNSNYGWFGGGTITDVFPFPVTAIVDRINFSNDLATASPRGSLTTARKFLAATGNSNYGWFGGGNAPATVATVDRIDFSNDSSTASVRGPLSLARRNLAAAGNSNYGWFVGGFPTPATAMVDRIDFSNDSVAVSIRGPLSSVRDSLAATSNRSR